MTGAAQERSGGLTDRLAAALSAARPHWQLGLVLLVVIAAALLNGARLPLLEGAEEAPFVAQALARRGAGDEPAYAALVSQFADHRVVHESPAYRWIAQAAIAVFADDPSPSDAMRPNPYLSTYDLSGTANRNTLLHRLSAPEVANAVRFLRAVSLVAILGATVIVYGIANRLTKDRSVATLTAVAIGLLPASVIASTTANADALAAFTTAALLALAVRLWERPLTSWLTSIWVAAPALGVLVSPAVGAISTLPLLAALVAVLHTRGAHIRRERTLHLLSGIGLYLLIRALCSLLTPAREPLPQQAAQVIVGLQAVSPRLVVTRLSQGLWGTLGWRSVPLDRVVYTVLDALAIISAGGLGLAVLRRWWSPAQQESRHGWWVVGTFALASGLRYGLLLWRDDGLLSESLSALTVPTSLLLAAGWCAWLPSRGQWMASLGLAVALFVTALVLPATTQRSAPPELNLAYLADENVAPVGIEYGDDLYLVGYSIDRDTVPRGQTVTVRLVWLARRRPAVDYTVSVEVTGRQRMQVGIANSMPGGGALPTSDWIPGQIIQDEIVVPISPVAHTPTRGDIRVTVYRGVQRDPLEAEAPNGASLGTSPAVGAIRVVPPYETRYEPAAPMQIDWGESVRLFGFGVNPVQPRLGDEWTIDLYWEALRPMTEDYTVFAHLVNAYGRILAQTDEQPLQGDYPTSLWRQGEQVVDRHVIAVPESMSGGPFYLRIGLYSASTGERLIHTASDGTTSDYLTFGPLLPELR